MQRLRLTFAKSGPIRFSGHLDLHKTWERVLRRARLPLAYSEGFSPHPRLQLAAALPLGFTSACEIADVWLEATQDLAEARAALERALPPGLQLLALEEVPALGPALQTQVRAAEYRVMARAPELTSEALDARIAALLAAPELRRVRREKAYDLRPLVEALERMASDGEAHTLRMRLSARDGATGRPEEVLAALELPTAGAVYHREQLFLAGS